MILLVKMQNIPLHIEDIMLLSHFLIGRDADYSA